MSPLCAHGGIPRKPVLPIETRDPVLTIGLSLVDSAKCNGGIGTLDPLLYPVNAHFEAALHVSGNDNDIHHSRYVYIHSGYRTPLLRAWESSRTSAICLLRRRPRTAANSVSSLKDSSGTDGIIQLYPELTALGGREAELGPGPRSPYLPTKWESAPHPCPIGYRVNAIVNTIHQPIPQTL